MLDVTIQNLPTHSFVSHLECGLTGEHYPADQLHGLSPAGKPLLVRYAMDKLQAAVSPRDLAGRPQELWRYREFLPFRKLESIVRLGEVMTPLIPLDALAAGSGALVVKDEGRLPTASFKARGLCMAVTMAKELGVERIAMPTNGNAGAALAAYATRAGIESFVFCPDDTPDINVREIGCQGAKVWKVNGLINDCGRITAGGKEAAGWFDLSTLKEPYRIEGKKTMGLELAEQMNWSLPDVIMYPTGGGTGLIGMWKAFNELQQLGWIQGKLPRMVAVQAEGCAPIVKAYDRGERFAELWENAATLAAGIRVPVAVGDFLILDAVRQSGGFATAVSDALILDAHARSATQTGLLLCPEGAATLAAYEQEIRSGRIDSSESVVLFNCASGLKYPLPEQSNWIDCSKPIDYGALIG